MKPAIFAYYDPISVDEALDLMSQFADQARPLAGGQSLVPLMNLTLSFYFLITGYTNPGATR